MARRSIQVRSDDRPDHRLRARLTTSYGVILGVPAEIFMPKRVADPVRIRFHPNGQQVHTLQASPSFSMFGRSKYGGRTLEFTADEVWTTNPISTGWGHGVSFHSDLVGEATTLRFSWFEGTKPRRPLFQRGTFWLTPHPLVNAACGLEKSYTGEVKVRLVTRPKFTLGGTPLRFRHHWKYVDNADSSWTTFSELVGEFGPARKPFTSSQLDSLLHDLDDWLLLASVAARQRCICAGYEVSGPRMSKQFYRRNLAMPQKKKTWSQDGLIDIQDFWPFMRSAHRQFLKFPEKDLLRRALFPLTSRSDRTIDASFVSLFSSLESLVLFVTRIRPPTAAQFRRFKDRFDYANTIYKFPLADLWPLFDRSKGASLAAIRNRVVHGDYLSPVQVFALSHAQQHVRWTIERILLTVLSWDIKKSLVRADFLNNWVAYHEWQRQISVF